MTWMDMELMGIAEVDRDEAMDGLDKKMKLQESRQGLTERQHQAAAQN